MSEWEDRALDAEAEVCSLQERIKEALALHRRVIDFDVSGEEVEHCEECGHISGEPPDDECPTVRALSE